MKIITDPRCTEYHKVGHPERPQRILRSVERFKEQKDLPIEWVEPAAPTDGQILRAHAPEHLRSLPQSWDFDADTPAYPGIADHARRSVGAALKVLDLALAGDVAFSLMRPPGHHATKEKPMGFCYLNNIAILALEARARGVQRVAVFDFDVHHGNGTEDILLGRDGFLFCSVHQWPAYPGTGQRHRGDNCFNYPVEPESTAATYRQACASALEQVRKFKPDLLAVSAGFDAYKGDFLCQQNMDVEDFRWIGQEVRALKIKTASLLEGGYSKALPELILAYLKGLNGV